MAVRPLDEYYDRDPVPSLYRPRYLPASISDWWHLLTTEPGFKIPSPSVLLSKFAWRCLMSFPWSPEFRERIDPGIAYQRGYERALADTGKKSALARVLYYHRCRTALLQLVRAMDTDDYGACLEAARTTLEESNPLLEFRQ